MMITAQPSLFPKFESEIRRAPVQEMTVPDVALAVLHNRSTDKVLLIRRCRASDFSGWVFPGGKIECLHNSSRKENPIAAARRELAEETGLTVSKRGKEIFCRQHPTTGVVLRYVYFAVDSDCLGGVAANQEPQKAEDLAWVELRKVKLMFRGGLSDGLVRGIEQACRGSVGRRRTETFDLG
jgi:ADP-ribose pyrophosphatase YjhB (NUDIX family)